MKPLPLEALRFKAVLHEDGAGGSKKALELRLRYYVLDGDREITLVHVNLRDDGPFDPAQGPVFWFHFTPVQRPMGGGETAVAMFPQIDLIVFSSVEVTIVRRIQDLDRYQQIGFENTDPKSRLRDNLFSPVRPKISLRRVHDRTRIPPLGSAHQQSLVNADFSAYFDEHRELQCTTRRTVSELLRGKKKVIPEDREAVLLAQRTWTHVFTEEHYTEFNFSHSSYSLRVHDQYFDEIDGDRVVHDDVATVNDELEKLSGSQERIHRAALLKSRPKFFDFGFRFEGQEIMDKEGVQHPYRTALDLWKSPNVLLTGSLLRSDQSDRFSKNFKDSFDVGTPVKSSRVPSYRDYLPSIRLLEFGGMEHIPFGSLEKSKGGKAAYEFRKNGHQKFLEFQFSLVVGFTPILGEAYGLYELYTALRHDEDPFGNKLSDTEKIIVAVAAILPFVGSGALRKGTRFVSKEVFPLLSQMERRMAGTLNEVRTIYQKL